MAKKPNLARLKIFGCEVYTKIQGPLIKLDSRSKKGIFVGYNMNGYSSKYQENVYFQRCDIHE
jgi:hypothetical protein